MLGMQRGTRRGLWEQGCGGEVWGQKRLSEEVSFDLSPNGESPRENQGVERRSGLGEQPGQGPDPGRWACGTQRAEGTATPFLTPRRGCAGGDRRGREGDLGRPGPPPRGCHFFSVISGERLYVAVCNVKIITLTIISIYGDLTVRHPA